MNRRPTLLVFTLGAARERARRPLLPAEHGGVEVGLRRACLERALEAGREAGCRLVVSAPPALALPADAEHLEQDGRGFGDRLERACRRAAEAGAGGTEGPLIVVGTDVPGLSAGHLREALGALAEDPERIVLGPSPDGGFYLLASARPLPGLAGLTRWCRPDTLRRLRRALRRAGRTVVLLEPLGDLDRRGDLERWVAGPAGDDRGGRRPGSGLPSPSDLWLALVRRLIRILAALRRPGDWLPLPPPGPAPVPVRSPRGPPSNG